MTLESLYRSILWRAFNIMPLKKNKIVFSNFHGNGFGDNCKYIALRLLRQNQNLDLVWLVKPGTDKSGFPEGIRVVEMTDFRHVYELSTAKVWVDNSRKMIGVKKRPRQFYLQCWHSGMSLKKIEGDMIQVSDPGYMYFARKDSSVTDLVLANSRQMEEIYRRAFGYTCEIRKTGTPRNDILADCAKHKFDLYHKYSLPEDKKIVAYAPTFRNRGNCAAYNINLRELLRAVQARFGGEWICVQSLHPKVIDQYENLNTAENVINIKGYFDMQELLAVADILVTDYSSTIFDFMITKKPMFLYATDWKHYENIERGMYFTREEMPCSVAENDKELHKNIIDFNHREYERRVKSFLTRWEVLEDGRASSRACEIIMEHLKN